MPPPMTYFCSRLSPMPTHIESLELPLRLGTLNVPVTEVKESPAGALSAAPPRFRSKAARTVVVATIQRLPIKEESFMTGRGLQRYVGLANESRGRFGSNAAQRRRERRMTQETGGNTLPKRLFKNARNQVQAFASFGINFN